MSRLLALLAAGATALAAAGPAAAQPKAIKIALVAKSEANFVFLAARRGAEEKARALSQQYGVRIEVAWLTPSKEDVSLQAERIRQAVRERAQAILAETPLEAVTELLKFDAAHPQLAGWAMVGGWPLFRSSQSPALMSEIQKRGLKVVAVDALPEQLIYVERGLVPVLWAQPVYDWGAIGVGTIADKLLFKKSVPKNIRMELIRVTRDDLRAYARRLSSWGFSLPQEYLAPK